jgi:hypothetical protein
MGRNPLIVVALCVLLTACTGPGRGITGNDTGGIIPYSPAVEGSYRQMAADYCAHWHRLSRVTSVHREYGDYISFVCVDRPGVIH